MMNHSHPVEEFHFPVGIFDFKTIRNLAHFHEMINRQNNLSRRNIIFEPTLITGSDGVETLNLQCKNQCNAYFRYLSLKKNENFSLKDYNHLHQHLLKQTHTYHQSIIERINKYLQQEDNRQDLHELRAQIQVIYRISSKQFDQLYSQAVARLKNNNQLYDGKEIEQLTKRLKNQRYIVTVDVVPSKIDRDNRSITKSILIVSDQMAASYKKYGQCCYFTVQEKHHINRWYVGALMGIARDMELTTFGIFLVKSVDSDHLKGVLKNFLASIDQKPQTFITQSHFYYDQVINELKNEGLIDSEHIYDYAIHCERLHRNNPKFRKIFNELSKEPLKRKFFAKLQEYFNSQNFNEIQMDLQELASLADKFCLSQIKSVPVGTYRTVRNKNTQKKTDFSVIRIFHKMMMEKQCNQGKHLYSKVKSIIAMLTSVENEECAEKNRIMDMFPELNALRLDVTRNVMENIMNKIYSSLQYRAKMIDTNTYQVSDKQNYLIVKKSNEKWACECEQSIKTMLPCVHEVLVCCREAGSFSTQIKRRWSNQDKILEEELRNKFQRKGGRNKRVTLSDFLA